MCLQSGRMKISALIKPAKNVPGAYFASRIPAQVFPEWLAQCFSCREP
jgi:hypothetical protein